MSSKNKKCTKCQIKQGVDNFRVATFRKDGRHPWCKDCERSANKVRYKPVEKMEKIVNLEQEALKSKTRNLFNRYGLTYEEYISMYNQQSGQCCICKIERPLGTPKGLYVDHCHSTQKIRGLLCPSCNTLLGRIKEDESILFRAICYIRNNKCGDCLQ